MQKLLLCLSAASFFQFGNACADEFILNIGPAPSGMAGLTVGEGYQWLGARFTLDHPADISAVKGWLGSNPRSGVLGDAGGFPNEAALYYSARLEGAVFGMPAWAGVSGLNWHLEPGDYWITFGDTRDDERAAPCVKA